MRSIGCGLAEMELPDWAKLGRVGVARRNDARTYSHRVLWSDEHNQWRCGIVAKGQLAARSWPNAGSPSVLVRGLHSRMA